MKIRLAAQDRNNRIITTGNLKNIPDLITILQECEKRNWKQASEMKWTKLTITIRPEM